CPFRIRAQTAGHGWMAQRFLDSKKNRFGRKEPILHPNRLSERVTAMLIGRGHDSKQSTPIHCAAARKVSGVSIEQPEFVRGNQRKSSLIEPTAPGASKHLKDLLRLEQLFRFIPAIGFSRQGDAPQ